MVGAGWRARVGRNRSAIDILPAAGSENERSSVFSSLCTFSYLSLSWPYVRTNEMRVETAETSASARNVCWRVVCVCAWLAGSVFALGARFTLFSRLTMARSCLLHRCIAYIVRVGTSRLAVRSFLLSPKPRFYLRGLSYTFGDENPERAVFTSAPIPKYIIMLRFSSYTFIIDWQIRVRCWAVVVFDLFRTSY